MLLQYAKWKKLLESSQIDAAYLRVEFTLMLDIIKTNSDNAREIYSTAINKTAAKFSDSLKIEKRSSERNNALGADVTISLVEEEGFEFFADAGVTEPHNTYLSFPFGIKPDVLYSDFIKWRKPVGIVEKNSPCTVILNPEDYEKSESELLEDFFNFFFEKNIYTKEDYPKLTNALIETAFLTTDRDKKEKLLEELAGAISGEVAMQYCLLLPFPTRHRTVNLNDYSRETKATLDALENEASNIAEADANTKKEFVLKVKSIQSKLASSARNGYIERKIAADGLVRSYDILNLSDLTDKEISDILS